MVQGVPNISIPDLSSYAAHGSKMSIPVDSSSLVYSHLEHVSGMPAPQGTYGVAISKLNLLDSLISQINRVNRNGASLAPGLKDGSVDSVIENLVNQVRQAKTDSDAMPYMSHPSAYPGAIFNLTT